MKVALVYDRVNKWGGAERVLLALRELFPKAPLYTSVYNPTSAPWAKDFQIQSSYLQRLPYASAAHEYYAVGMPTAFEQFSFDAYDLVISITSEAAKGIITKPSTKHICYCLTPTRYLWSGYDEYFSNPFFRALSYPAVTYLRKWDLIAANRPDVMVGISHEVQKRIKKYYQRDAAIIYPAVSFKKANRIPDTKHKIPNSNYFLVVSRLVSYKRIDLAVRACTKLQIPLVVVGTGSEEQNLKSISGPSVTFLGSLTDEALAAYYENCQALLFPGTEDFGLTVLEAQSFGKPVIAYQSGGALETIIEGKTGVFFSSQTQKALENALQEFNPKQFKASDCIVQSERFSSKRFKNEFQSLIKRTI